MTNVAKALYEFWSGFDIPAYVEKTVPDEAQLPYITYRLAQPDWYTPMSMYARVWYRSTSFVGLANKVDEISDALDGGTVIRFSDGSGGIVLFKDVNFVQYLTDENPEIKTAYISFIMHAMEV